MTHEEYDALEKIVVGSYNRGYADGLKTGRDGGYRSGLEDAWECARKIILLPDKGGIDTKDLFKIFDIRSASGILESVSINEAMQKIKEYEERQDQQASAKDCKKCKHFTDADEVHGYTPCGSCNANLRNFEPKQTDELEVGDEIIANNHKQVITAITNENLIFTFNQNGQYCRVEIREIQNVTGRHFPQIAEVLRQLRGDK